MISQRTSSHVADAAVIALAQFDDLSSQLRSERPTGTGLRRGSLIINGPTAFPTRMYRKVVIYVGGSTGSGS